MKNASLTDTGLSQQIVALVSDDSPEDEVPENPPGTSRPPRNCRTIWISDVHLGTRDCKDKLLRDFLDSHQADEIYLVGDFIDGWKMKSGVYWTRGFTKLIRQLLKMAKNGTPVYYISGNHDEFMRRFANHSFDNIHLLNKRVHKTADNRRFLVLHGDQFDGVATYHSSLRFIGDYAYTLLMYLNRIFNRLREKYGYGYWSLAGFLKHRVKQARKYIQEFEQGAAFVARKHGYDGVICGHIHKAANKVIEGTAYLNTGDWVESCTALVENHDGSIELVHWQDENSKVNASSSHNKKTEEEHAFSDMDDAA